MEKTSMNSLIPMVEGWFKQLPALPANIVDVLVKIAPWLALIFGILGVLGSLAAFGVLTTFVNNPYAKMWGGPAVMYGESRAVLWYVPVIGAFISSVMGILAFPGLKANKVGGWTLLFWSQVVSVVTSAIGISVGGVIGALIGFYILFQIKARYH